MTLDDHQVHQKQKLFREGFALDYVWSSVVMGCKTGTLSKMFLSKNVIFGGLRLFLGPFGQEVPESPVSQVFVMCINIFSTSFHCGLIVRKNCIICKLGHPKTEELVEDGIP